MEALAQQAGAGHVVRSYLDARSISSVGTLAMLAKDDEAFEASIVRPLLGRVRLDPSESESLWHSIVVYV